MARCLGNPGRHRQAPRLRLLGLAGVALLLLLAGGPDAAAQRDLGPSPLFDLAAKGDTGAVDYLLKKGEPVDLVGPGNETVLTIAAANGYLDMVELAVAKGARIDHQNRFGKTALNWASERGHVSVVEWLVRNGADIDHPTQEGLTPVMLAVRAGHARVVQLLLRHRPNLTLLDYTGRNALAWAKAGRDRRIESLLRRAGAPD